MPYTFSAVDFVVYMLLCIQLYNFRPIQDFGECLSDYISKESLINFIKVSAYFLCSLVLHMKSVGLLDEVLFLGLNFSGVLCCH